MKKIILVGKSGSGKTTVGLELEKLGIPKIVTYTTRPPRAGEIGGKDYHFISMERFNQLESEGYFAETASYSASFGFCKYGSALCDYTGEEQRYVILNPIGLKAILEKTDNVLPVYLEVSNNELKHRLLNRGDSLQEIERRALADEADFRDICDYVEYVLPGTGAVEKIARAILAIA